MLAGSPVTLKQIGNYRLTGKILGKGNFARVELAENKLTGSKVITSLFIPRTTGNRTTQVLLDQQSITKIQLLTISKLKADLTRSAPAQRLQTQPCKDSIQQERKQNIISGLCFLSSTFLQWAYFLRWKQHSRFDLLFKKSSSGNNFIMGMLHLRSQCCHYWSTLLKYSIWSSEPLHKKAPEIIPQIID